MQVPLQNNAEDWKLGGLNCYDAACVARLQTKLKLDFRGIAEGTVRACHAGGQPREFEAMLVAETLKADPDALGRLMADHTQVMPSECIMEPHDILTQTYSGSIVLEHLHGV